MEKKETLEWLLRNQMDYSAEYGLYLHTRLRVGSSEKCWILIKTLLWVVVFLQSDSSDLKQRIQHFYNWGFLFRQTSLFNTGPINFSIFIQIFSTRCCSPSGNMLISRSFETISIPRYELQLSPTKHFRYWVSASPLSPSTPLWLGSAAKPPGWLSWTFRCPIITSCRLFSSNNRDSPKQLCYASEPHWHEASQVVGTTVASVMSQADVAGKVESHGPGSCNYLIVRQMSHAVWSEVEGVGVINKHYIK